MNKTWISFDTFMKKIFASALIKSCIFHNEQIKVFSIINLPRENHSEPKIT